MWRHRLLISIVLLVTVADADAARRRSAGRSDPSDAPAAWLWRNAHALHSTEYPAPSFDLEPLRLIVGDASVVGLGDGTHGTHEFYTAKLRIIDFLVREMGFDVVAFEAPFPLFNRLDEYVQGGAGNPRELLDEVNRRLFYRFWDVEEMLAVIEWMRDYNAGRGERPAVHIAGADVYDGVGGARAVVAYLQNVDPAAATEAETRYGCVSNLPSPACLPNAEVVRDALAARRAELTAVTGARPFEEALQNATIVAQSNASIMQRDANMAENVEWLRENRGESRRVMIWAHQEHVGKTETPWLGPAPLPMGWHLSDRLGGDYVVIGSLTGGGSMLTWPLLAGGALGPPVVTSIPPLSAGAYETKFQSRPAVALLVPLAGAVPDWLSERGAYFTAGTVPMNQLSTDSLPAKLDAVIYIERTTATRPLSH